MQLTIVPFKRTLHVLSLTSLFLLSLPAFGQGGSSELIWSNTFDSQSSGYGYSGSSNTALSETEWTITYGGGTGAWATQAVSGDMMFGGFDLDVECTWTSRTIDISEYINLQASIVLVDDGNMEGNDFIRFEAIVDGSASTLAYESNDFGTVAVALTSISNGSTLQLRVTALNNHSAEAHYFDDVLLYGVSNCTDTDSDGICDSVDPCVGALDACGVCNGPGAIYDCGCSGIPAGDCDCNGTPGDVCGVCNGPGAIYDCGCSGIPAGDCDCNGNQLDALGVCGGSCAADADLCGSSGLERPEHKAYPVLRNFLMPLEAN